MQIIKTFNPENTPDEQNVHFEVKRSVRAVMLDVHNNIGLIYSRKLNYHTLPGGSIEKGETYEQVAIRECKEETGYYVNIINELGIVREIRGNDKKIGEIIGYTVKIVGEQDKLELDSDEIKEDISVVWVSYKKAEEIFNTEIARGDNFTHIGKRALAFLDEHKKSF